MTGQPASLINGNPNHIVITNSETLRTAKSLIQLQPAQPATIYTAPSENKGQTVVIMVGLCANNTGDPEAHSSQGLCTIHETPQYPAACTGLVFGSQRCDASRGRYGLAPVSTIQISVK